MGFYAYANDSESESSKFENIYVIVTSGGKVKVTTRNVKTPLSYIREIFIDEEVQRRALMKKVKPTPRILEEMKKRLREEEGIKMDSDGNFYAFHGAGMAPASFHFLLDKQTGKMYLVDHHYSGYLSQEERIRYFDAILPEARKHAMEKHSVEDVELVNTPIPNFDYDIMRLLDFPAVVDYATRIGMVSAIKEDEFVVMLNMKRPSIRALVDEQLSEEYRGENCRIKYNSFLYEENGETLFSIDPPFYLIDFSDVNIFLASRSLTRLVLDRFIEDTALDSGQMDPEYYSEDWFKYMAGDFSLDIDIGRSHGQVMHREIYASMHGWPSISTRVVSSAIDGNVDYYSQYSRGADADVFRTFVKSFIASITAMSRTKFNSSSGEYYYVVREVPWQDGLSQYENDDDAQTYAMDHYRRKELFDFIFTFVSSDGGNGPAYVAKGDGGDYLCLVSQYSIPMVALEFFGYETAAVFSYFAEAQVMMRSVEHSEERRLNSDIYDERVRQFPVDSGSVFQFVVDAARDYNQVGDIRHYNTNGIIRTLADYPLVFSIIKRTFDEVGVEYRPIAVTLSYQPEFPALGGYIPMDGVPMRPEEGALSLTDPPSISLNTARIRSPELIAEVLLHEANHYLDELMEQQGIVDRRLMIPPRMGSMPMDFMVSYLSESPTEFRSHAKQLLPILHGFGKEYVRKEQNALRIRLMNRFSGPEHDSSHNPLVEDAPLGSREIFVGSPERVVVGNDYDAIQEGDLNQLFNSGTSPIVRVHVSSVNTITGAIMLREPLQRDLSVSMGAALTDVVSEDTPHNANKLFGLYGAIIDAAILWYLEGIEPYLPGNPLNPPS